MVYMDDLKQPTLGAYCRELREQNEITVAEMSRRANCSRQTIYNFEQGETQSLSIFLAYKRLTKGE